MVKIKNGHKPTKFMQNQSLTAAIQPHIEHKHQKRDSIFSIPFLMLFYLLLKLITQCQEIGSWHDW